MQVGTGILGIDVLADIRDVSADLTNWEWSWGHAGQTILDVVGIVPLIGAVKYTDEAGSLLKPVFKYGDELAIAGGGTIKQTDEVADHITSITKENILDQVNDITKGIRNPNSKLSGKEVDLKWLGDNYKAVEIEGTVKVNGEVRDISRRVYQTEIDWNYIPKDPLAKGLTNKELALKGKSPYAVDKNSIEAKIELHHLTQVEAGSMVEIVATTHDEYTKILHCLVESGGSFRNNSTLDKQYSNFLKKYWRWRAKNL